ESVAQLQRFGVPRGLVNAGGDLRTFGETGYPITIRHPNDPGSALLRFSLTNGAIATSAHYFSDRYRADIKPGPIINPRTTGRAVTVRSASVRASSAMVADALTKVVMISGDAALPVLNHFHANSLFVVSEGTALCSSDWYATLDLSP